MKVYYTIILSVLQGVIVAGGICRKWLNLYNYSICDSAGINSANLLKVR